MFCKAFVTLVAVLGTAILYILVRDIDRYSESTNLE